MSGFIPPVDALLIPSIAGLLFNLYLTVRREDDVKARAMLVASVYFALCAVLVIPNPLSPQLNAVANSVSYFRGADLLSAIWLSTGAVSTSFGLTGTRDWEAEVITVLMWVVSVISTVYIVYLLISEPAPTFS